MRKLTLIAIAIVLIALSFHAVPVAAQPTGPPSQQDIQKMITDASTTDPDIERYLPRWKILEADLKVKIATYFKLEGQQVSEGDSMIVTSAFPKPGSSDLPDLLSIRVGPTAVLSGGQTIRKNLGEGLYQQILERNYAHLMIEPETPVNSKPAERIGYVMQPGSARQFVAASAFRQVVLIGSTGARLEHWIGNDEIGYHFWSSGQAKGMITYPVIPLTDVELRAKGVPDILTVQLGAAYRLKIGQSSNDFLGGAISSRLLNGSFGAKAFAHIDYRLPQVNDIGFAINAEVPFSKLEPETANMNDGSVVYQLVGERLTPPTQKLTTVKEGFFLRTIAQGMFFWETWLNDYEHFFRISLGASYQEVASGMFAVKDRNGNLVPLAINTPADEAKAADGIIYNGLIHPTDVQDWIYAKVEYMNQSGFPFGLSAQLANRNLLLAGYIPVIPNWLFVEAKYSTPILRDNPAPWEQRSFFMISPILRFKISGD
ncbi:MAG TPA: hypothetical protein VHI13_05650 [Candidatus Kapabacteria bacterium]|nr:hypothetical protein [Candidatus Kapabacteria bacterium]